jgi:hypothetical protein
MGRAAFVLSGASMVATGATTVPVAPERIAHPVGGVAAEGRHDVAVRVRGRAHLCVAEHLHDHPGVNALGQQQRGCGVPPVVEADLAYSRLVQEGRACLPVGLPLDRPPVGLREDEVMVFPDRTGGDALFELCDPGGLAVPRRAAAAAPTSGGCGPPSAPRRPGLAVRRGAAPAARSAFRWPSRRPPIAGPGLPTDADRLPAPLFTGRAAKPAAVRGSYVRRPLSGRMTDEEHLCPRRARLLIGRCPRR